MQNKLQKVLDETEFLRRWRQAELNAVGWPREVLESAYGKVWSTEELLLEWEVVGFLNYPPTAQGFTPLAVVKSRADGGLGSFEFQHSPRFYFNLERDKQ